MKEILLSLLLVLGVLHAGNVRADVLQITPSESILLPADNDGWARVLLRFDVSGLSQGNDLRILIAHLEWPLQDLARASYEFALHEVSEPWDPMSSKTGNPVPTVHEKPISEWQVEPIDFDRTEGLVRLDVRHLLIRWVDDPSRNLGVVLLTKNVTNVEMKTQLARVQLNIHYGVFGP